jgi:hypothetical protein
MLVSDLFLRATFGCRGAMLRALVVVLVTGPSVSYLSLAIGGKPKKCYVTTNSPAPFL